MPAMNNPPTNQLTPPRIYHGPDAVKKAMNYYGVKTIDPLEEHIIHEEGFAEGTYLDTAKNPVQTSGVGQTRENMGKDFFRETFPKYVKRSKRWVPDFDKRPLDVQKAILSATYRGDMGKDTAAALNKYDYRQAAIEILNHQGYRRLKKTDPDNGVVERMERYATTFLEEAKKRNGP